MDKSEWLRREIAEGPERTPPMPSIQVEIHKTQLAQMLGHNVVDLAFIRSLKKIPENPFYNGDEAA